MGHYARDCRAEEKVEETINLALDDATNGGILLMAQNEEPNAKGDGGAKDEQPNNREPKLKERELQWPEKQFEEERRKRMKIEE